MKSLKHLLLCLWSTACLSIDDSVKPYIVAYFAFSLFKVAKGIVIFTRLVFMNLTRNQNFTKFQLQSRSVQRALRRRDN